MRNIVSEAQEPQLPLTKTGGSKSKAKSREAHEQAITPKQSIWPFALACAVAVLLIGFVIHPIVFGIGVLLVIGAIIGWGLERR
jgi:Cytochrome c oxidase subunit IV